jgi:hypothetical protein
MRTAQFPAQIADAKGETARFRGSLNQFQKENTLSITNNSNCSKWFSPVGYSRTKRNALLFVERCVKIEIMIMFIDDVDGSR